MTQAESLPVWTRAGIAILAIVFLQLFFVGNLPARAEEASADEAVILETPEVQGVSEPDTMGLPEFITETLVPLVQAEPVVEEGPVVEEVVAEQPSEQLVDEVTPQEQADVEETPEQIVVEEEALQPQITTDQSDYFPWQTVTIFGKFFDALKNIVLSISGGVGDTYRNFVQVVTTDENGDFTATQPLDDVYRPEYTATASDEDGNVLAETTFTDANPAVDIAQCQNGGIGNTLQPCSETPPFAAANGYGYEGNANANGNNSHWVEGDFVPLRIVATNFASGAGYIDFSIDVTKGGKHAYDYVGSFNQTEGTGPADSAHANRNNPCGDIISGCSPTSADSEGTVPSATLNPFPVACGSSTFTGSQNSGPIKAWGTSGDLSVSYVSQNIGSSDCVTRIRVAWTATKSGFGGTIVIAYGAHIAKQSDWGSGNSAISISGSPYHSSLVERSTGGDVKGIGNQDAKLSANAVVVPSTLTVNKICVPSNDPGKFNLRIDGATAGSGANASCAGTTGAVTVSAGVHTVSETAGTNINLANYSSVIGGDCAANGSITIAQGENKVCTITNTLQQAHLTLVKTVTNDNGGTAQPGDWTLAASGPTNISGTTGSGSVTNAAVDAGAYTLSENSGPTGYTASTYSCVNNGGGAVVSNSITLAPGDNATCTINNNDNAPSLILNKVVVNNNGGNSPESAWTLTANGGADGSLSGPGAAGSTDVQSGAGFKAGTYALSESGPSGYSASSWSCTGTGQQNGSNITLALGQSATCTITNDDISPTLTLIKHVTNDNGGTKQVSDFVLRIDGNSVTSGASNNVNAGAHNASEVNLPGYTASNWSGDCAADGSVTLALAENKTCEITNNDDPAHLIVIKHVINNNGGTKVASDFTTAISGVSTATPNAPGAEAPGIDNVLTTVGAYSVDEGAHDGYSKSLSDDCSGTITLGETKTCTITNDDIAPSLTLDKIVINDNGGTRTESEWTLQANGPTTFFGPGAAGSTDVVSGATFAAGTYTLSESGPSDYDASSWTCVGGSQNGNQISLTLGQSATCTITNNDKAPALHLRKVVVNDNGGTASETDWTLTATGTLVSPTNLSGSTPVDSGSGFKADTYTLAETGPSGYSASSWVCVGGTQNGSNITVALGQSATCTITNNDIAPKLHLRKVVVNDNGGSATLADFTLTADGTASNDLSGTSPVDSDGTLKADTFALSETNVPGYSASDWVCVGGSQNGASITLAINEEATCTITNDDQQAYITVVKVVNNNHGGNAAPDDFNLTLSGDAVTSGVQVPVNPGTYTAGETLLDGYTFDGYTGDCDDVGDVTVALGESKTCTLTNSDQQAYITVVKVVNNTYGGTALPDDFSLTLAGNPATSGVAIPVNPGTYTSAETLLPGYSFDGFSGDCDSNGDTTVALGESKTCTLTNNDIAPKLTLLKTVVNDNGGTAVESDFQGKINGNNVPWGVAQTLTAGNFTASETNLPGYTASFWGGDCADNGSVTLNIGDNKTCTITNDDQQAFITVIKVVVNDNGGTAAPDDFNLTLDGGPAISGVAIPVNPGTYTADETLFSGYTFSGFSGDCNSNGDITVALGESKSCTLTNNDIAPKLHLRKVVVNDNGGSATLADFTLTADGTASNDLSGTSPVDSDGTLKADTFALSETNVPGYSASDWVCVGGSQNGASITLAINEEATCTITNDDISPKLTLIKTVINDNGGNALTTDFQGKIDGVNVAWEVTQDVDAGNHTASETNLVGYTAGAWGGDCAANGSITLALAQEATCTITNDDQPGTLIVKKIVINDNGGTKQAQDFSFQINGGTAEAFEADGQNDKTVNAGTYSVVEVQDAGYTTTYNNCSNLVIPVGGSQTCTITNDDVIQVTRTQGFWQTHTEFTTKIFNQYAGTLKIGNKEINSPGRLFGAFYSSIPKLSNGKTKRSDVDQAKMQLLQQWVAAKLNCKAFGCSSAVNNMLTAASNAFLGNNKALILNLAGQIDAYNNSGDSGVIPAILGNPGKATPKDSQGLSDDSFWDSLI